MIEMQIGDQTIRYDREATAAVYEKIECGWAQKCGCAGCRNFAAQRDVVYPPSFRELLEQLGIDPNKESEIDEYGPIMDGYPHDRFHFYDGWLSFVGELVSDGGGLPNAADAHEFEFWFSPGLPAHAEFRSRPYLAVEFKTRVKWVIAERPESHDTAGNKWIVNELGQHVKVKPDP